MDDIEMEEGTEMKLELPPGMTEQDVLDIVRELIGGDGDMTDSELLVAYQSGMFQELCPDIEAYAKQRAGDAVDQTEPTKEEESNIDESRKKDGGEKKTESQTNNMKPVKVKHEAESEDESVERNHHHHKKKKKKHHKEHRKRDRDADERKEKEKSKSSEHRHEKDKDRDKVKEKSKSEVKLVDLVELSDSESERRKKKEKRRKTYISSSSDNDSDHDRHKHKSKPEPGSSKDITGIDKKEKTEAESKGAEDKLKDKPKVHPFYQDKGNKSPTTQSEKIPEKKKEPKPFSKYNRQISKGRWRPQLDKEHFKYQRRFRLKPVSVVCVDLLDFPTVFHHPRSHAKGLGISVPLVSGTTLSTIKQETIRRMERDKANWYKKKINKIAMKYFKLGKHRRNSSDDDDRRKRRHRIMNSTDSDSSSSSVMMHQKMRKGNDGHTERGGGKLSKTQRDKQAALEQLKRKVHQTQKEKLKSKGTRVLPWENKNEYFNKKHSKDDPAKERERLIAEKRKRHELARKEKEKQNAPSTPFQRILKQIDSANKEQAKKPRVELKIPKKNQNPDTPVPISEYKVDGKIGVGDVYKEVTKLLCNNVLVECPVMDGEDLGEYTVKKIAWWILKNEKDPAVQGFYHPEMHDDDDMESIHSDDFDWPDDDSSITGCVSDPEGRAGEVPPDPAKIADPDWADDYCGEASLYAKFRKITPNTQVYPIDSHEPFLKFLRTKPGTNYSKPNFEVKCFICNEVIVGQRRFGAHIRSEHHKNKFRNYSLDLANYEENLVQPPPVKHYVAKLVEYTKASTSTSNSDSTRTRTGDATGNNKVARVDHARSDSPGPIVAGDAAPNIIVHQVPIPDDISLPSIEDYDISSDESLQNVRVKIVTIGKWNEDLEKRWRTWRDEEAKVAERYNTEREYFIENPERHPSYQDEWMKFWDRRCGELEAEGKDTENYDFHKEWMQVWLKRMQEIMHEKVENEVAHLKSSLFIDKHILRQRFGISAEATKRTRVKKKKNGAAHATSSLKSSNKGGNLNNGVPSQRQPMSNANNVHHSKPSGLPTPPITDEVNCRNNRRGSFSSNENDEHASTSKSDGKHGRNHKDKQDHKRKDINDRHASRKERKHDYHHHHHNHRRKDDKHDRSRDKHDHKSKHSDDRHENRKDRSRKEGGSDEKERGVNLTENHVSKDQMNDKPPTPTYQENSNSQSSFKKLDADSVSSISSTEPPPPGEEPLLLDINRSSNPGRPPPNQLNRRVDISSTKEKIGSQNVPITSKPNEKSDNDNEIDIDDQVKTKQNSSWLVNSSDDDEPIPKRQRRDSDGGSSGSGSSNTRELQERLKALREALAHEEAGGKKSTDRPRVIPQERTQKLSDGEVASDVSDLNLNDLNMQGVSTFVNKKIPGLPNINKDKEKKDASSNNLNKNSLGHHLLDRKKSTDEKTTEISNRDKWDGKSKKDHRHHKDNRDRSHSSSRHDRDRHKSDQRGAKDDRHRFDGSSKDNRNHQHKDYRGGNYDHRNSKKDFNPRSNNQSHFKTSNFQKYPPSTPMQPPLAEESWEQESWEPQQPSNPISSLCPPVPPATPLMACQIPPINTCQIPVVGGTDASSWQPPVMGQHYSNSHNDNQFTQNNWGNGGWGDHTNAPNNQYYNNHY